MGLSAPFIEAHITSWEAKLRNAFYPHREKWPSRLFHHSPLENAVQILQAGQLSSRNATEACRARDVAAPGVIATREHAHSSVRFYFRPRTPTQFHIEGIRRANECVYGDNTHAPILVMFVTDARVILAQPGTHFCDRNMQLGSARPDNTEEYFSKIPFDKVYHEGGTGGDPTIKEHRCAEVLATSPVSLAEALEWIYCRSEAERTTLLYLLGDAGDLWRKRILISDDLKVFQKEYSYVEEVSITPDGVVFRLNPRRDASPVSIRLEAWNLQGALVASYISDSLPSAGQRWIVNSKLAEGAYKVKIAVEGHRAFEAELTLGSDVF